MVSISGGSRDELSVILAYKGTKLGFGITPEVIRMNILDWALFIDSANVGNSLFLLNFGKLGFSRFSDFFFSQIWTCGSS